jgi:hypothetical protein
MRAYHPLHNSAPNWSVDVCYDENQDENQENPDSPYYVEG